MQQQELPSTKPYFIRALYEWCADAGFTPYITVAVDETVMVPSEFVQDGEITLNVSADATTGLVIGNDAVSFKARFRGVVREVMVPVERIRAVFARENGHGMVFAVSEVASPPPAPRSGSVAALRPVPAASPGSGERAAADMSSDPPKPGGRPSLVRVK